ncbi:unnamed protein product [Closterium sp. NIES-54]
MSVPLPPDSSRTASLPPLPLSKSWKDAPSARDQQQQLASCVSASDQSARNSSLSPARARKAPLDNSPHSVLDAALSASSSSSSPSSSFVPRDSRAGVISSAPASTSAPAAADSGAASANVSSATASPRVSGVLRAADSGKIDAGTPPTMTSFRSLTSSSMGFDSSSGQITDTMVAQIDADADEALGKFLAAQSARSARNYVRRAASAASAAASPLRGDGGDVVARVSSLERQQVKRSPARNALSGEISAACASPQRFLSPMASPAREMQRRSRRSMDCSAVDMQPLVEGLASADTTVARNAAESIRKALKESAENCARLVTAEGVSPLVRAILAEDRETAEHAMTALLFLAVTKPAAVAEITSAGGLRNVLRVLAQEPSGSEFLRSNAAAALFPLANSPDAQKTALAAGVLPPLVALLREASCTRTKKDTCLALVTLGSETNGAREIVATGVVPRLIQLLVEAEAGVEELAAAVLGVVARVEEGWKAIRADEDGLSALVECLEGGVGRAKEHSASTLLQVVKSDPDSVAVLLAEGCLPALVALSNSNRQCSDAKELLELLRAACNKRSD